MKKNNYNDRNWYFLCMSMLCLAGFAAIFSCSAESSDDSNLTILANPLRYSGYYLDAESGMNYCRARYYSPELMTFITRDSFDVPNRYGYCGGMPIRLLDLSGHSPEDAVGPDSKVVQQYEDKFLNKYKDIFIDNKTLHIVDIDDTLVTLDGSRFVKSETAFCIPECVLKSPNVILFTFGQSLMDDESDPKAMLRREAVERFFPDLKGKECHSINDFKLENIPINMDEHCNAYQPSKWAFLTEASNCERYFMWDNDKLHIREALDETTRDRLKTIPQSSYFVHVTGTGPVYYKFERESRNFMRLRIQ